MAELNEAELQQQYDKAKLLADSIECLVKNSDKSKTLQKAAKAFDSLGDYKDSKQMASKCKADAEDFAKKPENLPPHPKNPLDEKKNSKAFVWTVRVVALLVVVCILSAFYLRTTDHGCYLRSSFYEKIGSHEKAYKMFLHIKEYRDSLDKYYKNRYKHASQELKKKHYKKARDAFRDITTYKDSGEKLAYAEIQLLKKTKVHGDVLFGEAHWIVAEKKDGKAFLIKTKPTSGLAYNTEDKAVTWKDCSLREYLNSSFMYSTFTSAMIDKIIKTKVVVKDNKEYGTKGCTTKDKVYMLNADQSYKYGEDLNVFLRDYWLIGPGETQREAQFVSFGQVKEAGYPVNDRYINTRPCMWVNIK